MSQALFRVTHRFLKKTTQKSVLRLESYKQLSVWKSTGKCLGQWAPPVLWNFTPEQVQDPDKLVKYLGKGSLLHSN